MWHWLVRYFIGDFTLILTKLTMNVPDDDSAVSNSTRLKQHANYIFYIIFGCFCLG